MHLEPIRPEHADVLFPLIFRTQVTDTIVWDGPDSLEGLRAGYAAHAARPVTSLPRVFAIVDGQPVGTCDLREVEGRAKLGLWVGLPFQGRGLGTYAIGALLELAFTRFDRVEASVFVGNHASRRALEKNGFAQVGTTQVLKRSQPVDEWVFLRHRELGAAT